MTEMPRSLPDIRHIPGPPAPPVVGHTLQTVRDSYGLHRRLMAEYGPVYRVKVLGLWRVCLAGPDAVEFLLMDREKLFSSHHGWEAIQRVFPGGLMLRDFDEHRAHRRIMQAAFRAGPMRAYLARMGPALDRLVADWPEDENFAFYPAIKALTLRIGAAVFMGLALDDPRAARLNRALMDEVAASLAVIRAPLPFTPMGRGVRARTFLLDTFRDLIAERRAAPGDDFFSQMCVARDEDGQGWTDAEILDHFNFLLMAAHDTTASGLATLVWALGAHPEWQDAVAEEVATLGDGPLDEAALARMDLTDRAFREALRLVPPVPIIPRRAVRGFDWAEHHVPAGAYVTALPGLVMVDPDLWTAPECFDPDRFAPERAEDQRHKFAWAPFGGGAHKCIGMHFSTMQVKAFIATFLRRYRIALAGSPEPNWQRLPIPKPKNDLPIRLIRREALAQGAAVAVSG